MGLFVNIFELSVSVCDEVWALDANGNLLKHATEMLYLHSSSLNTRSRINSEEDEDSADWVLVA